MEWSPGLSVVLAVGLWAGAASAQTATEAVDPERFSLSWVRGEGAEACPGRAELAREVTKRLGRPPFDEQAARSIEIQVTRGPRGFETSTKVRDPDGQVVGRRELSSEEASCEPIFSATVLAVALLIDPEADLSPDTKPASVERFEETSLPEPPGPRTVPKDVSVPELAPTREVPVEEQAPPLVAAPNPAGVGLEGAVGFGLLPEPGPGASLFASYRPGARFGLSAGALYLESSTASRGEAVFDVGLTAFSLAGTLDFLPQSSVRWTAELGPMVGALHVSVRSPTPIDPGDFAFVALTGGSRLQVPLGRVAFASVRGAAVLNFVRRGLFVKGEEEAVFREPLLGGLLSAGLGLSFF